MSTTDPQPASRRGFLGALGAFFAALFGLPSAATVLDPALGGAAGDWIDAGPEADVRPGVPKRVSLAVKTAWEERPATAFLVREGDAIVAFSAVCTHLQCKVRFREGRFRCPCHQGVFALDGSVESGPPERPLDRFEVKVENGQVKVKA